jgi:hypothetical protein
MKESYYEDLLRKTTQNHKKNHQGTCEEIRRPAGYIQPGANTPHEVSRLSGTPQKNAADFLPRFNLIGIAWVLYT